MRRTIESLDCLDDARLPGARIGLGLWGYDDGDHGEELDRHRDLIREQLSRWDLALDEGAADVDGIPIVDGIRGCGVTAIAPCPICGVRPPVEPYSYGPGLMILCRDCYDGAPDAGERARLYAVASTREATVAEWNAAVELCEEGDQS